MATVSMLIQLQRYNPAMDAPDEALQQRVARVMGRRPIVWRRAEGGYTPAQRWIVTFEDGSSCYVKAAVNDWTAAALRSEYTRVYSQIEASFLPKFLGWDDHPAEPLLLLEDLSHAFWPPPWASDQIEAVRATLEVIRQITIDGLPRLEDDPACRDWWCQIDEEPSSFLALGIVSSGWLLQSLPILRTASESAPFHGEDLVHFDIRSDNICFTDDRVVIVDWNNACRGNGDVNIATWLPSLHAEGGPKPESILQDQAELATWMSGYWGWYAALPGPERLRQVQLFQLRSALPWAARALGLPPLDGPNAP
jgi:hypothetical protein